MKGKINLVFSLVACFALSACDPGGYIIDSACLKEVVSAELIDYENPNQKKFISWLPDHFDDLKAFERENVTVIERLGNEKLSDFLESFSRIGILANYYAYDSPKDLCIRLNYSNGNFLIIWADYEAQSFRGYIGEYLADGTVLSFWGSFVSLCSYEDLVNNYFSYNLSVS